MERNGLLMAWNHPEDHPPIWEIPEISELADPDHAPPQRRQFVVAAPLQEMAENGADSAHFGFVHGQSIAGRRRPVLLPALRDRSARPPTDHRVVLGFQPSELDLELVDAVDERRHHCDCRVAQPESRAETADAGDCGDLTSIEPPTALLVLAGLEQPERDQTVEHLGVEISHLAERFEFDAVGGY